MNKFSMKHWIMPRPILASPISTNFHWTTGTKVVRTQTRVELHQEKHSLLARAPICTAASLPFCFHPSWQCHCYYHPTEETQIAIRFTYHLKLSKRTGNKQNPQSRTPAGTESIQKKFSSECSKQAVKTYASTTLEMRRTQRGKWHFIWAPQIWHSNTDILSSETAQSPGCTQKHHICEFSEQQSSQEEPRNCTPIAQMLGNKNEVGFNLIKDKNQPRSSSPTRRRSPPPGIPPAAARPSTRPISGHRRRRRRQSSASPSGSSRPCTHTRAHSEERTKPWGDGPTANIHEKQVN